MEINIRLFKYEFRWKIHAHRTGKDYEIGYVKSALELRRTNKKYVTGYCNRCQDGKYIVFMDYDRIAFEWLTQELQVLQDAFKLGDFYIFESSSGCYHVVCLDRLSFFDYVTLLRNSSVDRDYIDVPLKYGKKVWTLRFTEKNNAPVRFAGMIQSKYKAREQSLAHAKVLNSLYNLEIKPEKHDGRDKLLFCRYPV